jgi:hypothetical protein
MTGRDEPWHGFRETLNCGHFKLLGSRRRVGQVTGPCRNPIRGGPEHWYGT